jgi:hypothetical protein
MRTALTATISILVVATLVLFGGEAFAGGAANPPIPNGTLDTSDNITAVIVLDPNGPVPFGADFFAQPSTPTGTFGSIEITRPGFGTAAANFQVQPGSTLGNLRHGCNLSLTPGRFVEVSPGNPGLPIGGPSGNTVDTFANWMPSGLTKQLFTQLQVPMTNGDTILAVPGIASVISQSCEPFPAKNKTEGELAFADIIAKQKVNPAPPAYPDRSAGDTLWTPGILVLKVQIGLWK